MCVKHLTLHTCLAYIAHMQNISTPLVTKRAYTLREVAAMTGRSYHTIHRMVTAGTIKVISGFGVRMVSTSELDRFLGQSETWKANPNRVAAQLNREGDAQ